MQPACHHVSICFPKVSQVLQKSSTQSTERVCVSAGVLACLDGYMNIAIEQTEEYVNGQLKNKYGDAFLRGNNGIFTCR
uniref:LSM6 homolog, U6 small nuclear RNA and mRNA degradation associated n=1 Tax=Amphiprion percula TaxID=161767 RepID=A0A3P8U8S8_AMPPE